MCLAELERTNGNDIFRPIFLVENATMDLPPVTIPEQRRARVPPQSVNESRVSTSHSLQENILRKVAIVMVGLSEYIADRFSNRSVATLTELTRQICCPMTLICTKSPTYVNSWDALEMFWAGLLTVLLCPVGICNPWLNGRSVTDVTQNW